ncbi:MAG: DUF1048 domain-containing protein [Bacilli bacterium]
MNFWEKITGNDLTKKYKAIEARAEKLPVAYQEAWKKIKEELWLHSDFTGRNLVEIFSAAMSVLEEIAAENQPVEDVFGDDVREFCRELVGDDGANSYRDQWRKQLNENIAKKLGGYYES